MTMSASRKYPNRNVLRNLLASVVATAVLGRDPVAAQPGGIGNTMFTAGQIGVKFVGNSPKFKLYTDPTGLFESPSENETVPFVFVQVDAFREVDAVNDSIVYSKVQSYASIDHHIDTSMEGTTAIVDFSATYSGRAAQACTGKEPPAGTFNMITAIASEDTVVNAGQLDEYTVEAGTAKFSAVVSGYTACDGENGEGTRLQFGMSIKGAAGTAVWVGASTSNLSTIGYSVPDGMVEVEFPNVAVLTTANGATVVEGTVEASIEENSTTASLVLSFPIPAGAGLIDLNYDPTVHYVGECLFTGVKAFKKTSSASPPWAAFHLLSSSQELSADTCAGRCLADTHCQSFTFETDGGCRAFKRGWGYTALNTDPSQDTSTFYSRSNCEQQQPCPAETIDRFRKFENSRPGFASSFIQSTRTDTAADCASICLSTFSCQSFSWLKDETSGGYKKCQLCESFLPGSPPSR